MFKAQLLLLKLLVILNLTFLIQCHPSHAATPEKRVALVIGNSAYQNTPPLTNPKNDANEMGKVLKRVGFDVDVVVDATKSQMDQALRRFGNKLDGSRAAVFYYAGHGIQVDGVNYILPIDASLKNERDLKWEASDLTVVLNEMEGSNRVNLLFLDACRDNPLSQTLARSMGQNRSSSIGRGLAPMKANAGTLISYSTKEGEVAVDGKGKHSPYTEALLKHIETPGVEIGLLLRKVREEVIAATKNKQVPWEYGSLLGEFYFTGPVTIQVQPAPDEKGSKSRLEGLYWESIMNDKNPAAFEAYLKKYPDGEFADLAKIKIADLKKEMTQTGTAPVSESGPISPPPQPAPSQKPVDQPAPKPDTSMAQPKPQSPETTTTLSSQRFTVDSNEIIKDLQTGYEWIVGPDQDMTWDQADSWAKGLQINNKDWRLPSKSEVADLYQKGTGTRNLDPVFQTSGWYIWTVSTDQSNAWSFYLYDGEAVNYLKNADKQRRAFAIKSAEKTVQKVPPDKASSETENPKYTKLGQNGETLPFSATSWIMVRDNETGLIWEVKQNKDGVKNYYDPNDADNEYNWNEANQKFVDALNNKRFGGYSDWRLPTREELKTLVDSSRSAPAINIAHFPNTQSSYYWASTTLAGYNTNRAWSAHFRHGIDGNNGKLYDYYVRAVRGDQIVFKKDGYPNSKKTITVEAEKAASSNTSFEPSSKYSKLDSNGKLLPESAQSWLMVLDNETGLIWEVKQNKDGVTDYGNPNDADNEYNWHDANREFIGALNSGRFGGYSDWRLPSREELKTLVITTTKNPAINTDYFPNTAPWYWSASPNAGNTHGAWGLDFRYGYDRNYSKYRSYYVRAVRGGQ